MVLLIIAIIIFTSISTLQIIQNLNSTDKQVRLNDKLTKSNDWDADGWNYRRELTLTPNTPESDYQIRVDLNPSNFNYSKAKPDGSDIRFYDLGHNLLDYWREFWNPVGNSIIWVKIPTSGTSTIYMYYGNPTVLSLSNGTNTFIFFDDFEGASLDSLKWDTEIGSYCGISVSSGYVRVYSATPSAFVEFAEVGFTDFEGEQGVPYSGYYTNGHAMTRLITDTTWFTGEIRILNYTYAPFYKNDVFDSADTSTRTGPLPTRFFSHSCVGGSGAPYWAYISSINTSLGIPGRAVRFEGWNNIEGIADFRMEWVFVFKFNENNPIVNIGPEEEVDDTPPEIIINSPKHNDFFGAVAPNFNISIHESDFDTAWYTIDGGLSNYSILGNIDTWILGTINQTAWDNAPYGIVTIDFYAKDKTGNEGHNQVIVVKERPSKDDPVIPGINVYLMLLIFSVAIILLAWRLKKKK
ncbi:MAG: DUF2341 domain-containing protein [Promethearchaeota archaeon]